MKAKLLAGQPALGCSVMFPSPQIVEMLGHAGFDWVLLDCEHGSLSLSDVELMAMAADAVGITAIARPRSNANADIQSVMDRGVMGVQVPHVNTADDARRAVSAVKFGPAQAAGWRPGRARTIGASAPRWRISRRRRTSSRWSACSSSTRRRFATSTTSSRSRASTCFSSARPICRSRWAIPAIRRACGRSRDRRDAGQDRRGGKDPRHAGDHRQCRGAGRRGRALHLHASAAAAGRRHTARFSRQRSG